MDSKVNAATWALDRGVSVVICNGTQDKAIKTIIAGRKVGTFFTETAAGGPTPVDTLAENGKDAIFFFVILTRSCLLLLFTAPLFLRTTLYSNLPFTVNCRQKKLYLSSWPFDYFAIVEVSR